jgi:type I restriction enzyme R subunit
MVVTQSRESALKYYFRIKKYIEEQGYGDIRALVAFSGEINLDGINYSEVNVNKISETQLPEKFDGDEYQLLVVAEKYQTGFDQPKLTAMYVDRKLKGLQAVQTLSRLNRVYPYKEMTHILDFQNSVEDIRDSFKPFFEIAALEERTDLNQIYELETRLFSFGILDKEEIHRFASILFAHTTVSIADRPRLEGLVREAVSRFQTLEEEGKREEFRQLLKSYGRFYAFVAQVVSLNDNDLEKLYAYSTWLLRLLPNREVPPDIEVTEDMLRLSAFRVELIEERDASLAPEETAQLPAIKDFGANQYTAEEEKTLSEIVQSFNERHGTEFTNEDFLRFETVNNQLMREDNMVDMLRNNPPDVVYGAFEEAFRKGAIRMFQRDEDMKNILLSDPLIRTQAVRHFFNRALRSVREG